VSIYVINETPSLAVTVYDSNGNPSDAGAVTLSITLPDSTTAGPFTGVHGQTGQYTYAGYMFTNLGRHTLTWTFTGANAGRRTQTVDVYGATICTPADVRAWEPQLAHTVAFPEVQVRDAIRVSVDRLHTRMRVATAPFASTYVFLFDGDECAVSLPYAQLRSIQSLTSSSGTPMDTARLWLDSKAGLIELRQATNLGSQVTVSYTHGYDTPPPDTARIVAMLVHDKLVPSAAGPRATSISNDLGYMRITVAGRDGSFGIPEVDSFVNEYGFTSALGFA
jgi:hypothetical protein